MFPFSTMNRLTTFLFCICVIFNGKVNCQTPVSFTETDPFYDISLNNFIGANGKETQWSYKFTGRAGTKVSIHFFTKLQGSVDINVYDGPTNGSPKIDISSILATTIFSNNSFVAPPINATANTMFIEITAQPLPSEPFPDFQAIVTDHENKVEDGCTGFLALGITYGKLHANMNGNNCINILRAVDVTNSPAITGYLQFETGTDTMKVYKGLRITDQNELMRDANPLMIADRNVVVKRSAPASIFYNWEKLSANKGIMLSSGKTTGSLMTRDYITFLPQYLQKSIIQSFVFQPVFTATYPAGSIFTLEFSFLRNLGSSTVQIMTTDPDGNLVKTYNITDNGTLPQKLTVVGPIMTLTYSTTEMPYETGLYATYQLISLQPPRTFTTPKPDKASSSVYTITIFIIMLIKLYLF